MPLELADIGVLEDISCEIPSTSAPGSEVPNSGAIKTSTVAATVVLSTQATNPSQNIHSHTGLYKNNNDSKHLSIIKTGKM